MQGGGFRGERTSNEIVAKRAFGRGLFQCLSLQGGSGHVGAEWETLSLGWHQGKRRGARPGRW